MWMDGDLILAIKSLKNQLYIYPLSVRESQDTKLI